MNKIQNQSVFSTFHDHKMHLVDLGSFTDQNNTFPFPFICFSKWNPAADPTLSYTWSLPSIDETSIFLNTLYITVLHNQFCLQRYQGCSVTTPKEFLFVEEKVPVRLFRYKPVMFNNLSMCLGKETSCKSVEKLSLLRSGINVTDKVQRHCVFKHYRL